MSKNTSLPVSAKKSNLKPNTIQAQTNANKVNFDLVQKNSRNPPDTKRLTGNSIPIESGKMTPKRQPPTYGFVQS